MATGKTTKSISKPLTAEQQKLIEDSMESVRIIAMTMCKRLPLTVQAEDLISAGYLGLVECAPRFDGRCKFATFARKRILGAMKDYLRREDLLTKEERRSGNVTERYKVPFEPRMHDIENPHLVRKLDAGIDARRQIHKLKRIAPRAAFVAEQHYLRERTLVDIGREIGVNESRTCQICIKAIAQMRAA